MHLPDDLRAAFGGGNFWWFFKSVLTLKWKNIFFKILVVSPL